MLGTKVKSDFITNQSWKLNFFTIWVGQAVSLLGSQLVSFAVIWYLTETTGSAKVLATAAMMEWLPRVFVGPVAGTIADRWNRRYVMLAADGFTALATGALIYLGWAGDLLIWHIYLLMMARSIGGSFHFPAMTASTALMVPNDQLARIQGLNQLLQGIMNIAAPPLGAVLVAVMPLHNVLALDVGTAALAILPLLFVRIPQPERKDTPEGQKISLWADLRSGLRYVWNWSGLRKIIGLAILINLISVPAFILVPLLVTQTFSGAAIEIAAMQSALAFGFLAGGLLLALWGGFKRKIVTATLAVFGSAVGFLMVGFSPMGMFWVADSGIFTVGFMSVLTNGPTFALLQTVVDADMQGRVMALLISLANAMTPLGLLVSGPLAEGGEQLWFLLAGVVFVFAGLYILGSDDIRNIEQVEVLEPV